MSDLGIFAIALVLILSGVASRARRRPPPPPSQWPTMAVVVGDSFGVGLGAQLAKLRPQGAQFSVTAEVGATTRAAFGQLGDVGRGPGIAFVSLGTNDGAGVFTRNEWTVRTSDLVARLRALGWRVVWLLPDWGPAASLPVPDAEVWTWRRPALEGDRLHPTADSYRVKATELARWMGWVR